MGVDSELPQVSSMLPNINGKKNFMKIDIEEMPGLNHDNMAAADQG